MATLRPRKLSSAKLHGSRGTASEFADYSVFADRFGNLVRLGHERGRGGVQRHDITHSSECRQGRVQLNRARDHAC